MPQLLPSVAERFKRYRQRRRDTAPLRYRRAARYKVGIQWILLLVLVGTLGLLIYSTSARMLGDPITSTVPVDDPIFRDSVGPLLGAEFLKGNKIEPLING